jgi:hypothetical protein
MGVAYSAEDVRRGRQLVVNFIADDEMQPGETLARFEREARLASGRNHPHICQGCAVESFTLRMK